MMRKSVMKRRSAGKCSVVLALLCGTMLLAGCTKNGTGDGAVTPSENAPTVTAVATPSAEVTPTAEPTPTEAVVTKPTETPTPTPTVAYGSVEQLRRNRELQEIINPKREPAKTGTAPALSEQDKLEYKYGIVWGNRVPSKGMILATGAPPLVGEHGATLDGQILTAHVSGMRDETVMKKINDRIDEVVAAMGDPAYLPNVSGILSILKERGEPQVSVSVGMDYFCERGVLPVSVYGHWVWTEIRTVSSSENLDTILYERWPMDDEIFWAGYDILEEDEEAGTKKVQLAFRIREVVDLNFNLATGEELALADFFPAGYDYLEYLNDEIERQLRQNTFWFKDYYYQETGEIQPLYHGTLGYDYRDNTEYDGGYVFTGLSGNETFSSGNGYLSFRGFSEETISVRLPEMLPDLCQGKAVFDEEPEIRLDSLGTLYMCDTEFDTAIREKIVGTIPITSDDGKKRTVTVYKGSEKYPVWSPEAMPGKMEDVVGECYTDEEILAFIQEWLTKDWPREQKLLPDEEWYKDVQKDFPYFVTPVTIEYYPNGYAYVRLNLGKIMNENTEDIWESHYYADMWVKDGKYVAPDGIFDVSGEELLTLLLADLCRSDGKKAMTPEEASVAAKVLEQYILRYNREDEPMKTWNFDDTFTFSWGSVNNIYSTRVDEILPKDVQENLPKVLMDNLLQDLNVHVNLVPADPYLYLKHLRMYEGYSFD